MATDKDIIESRIIGYIKPFGTNARVTVVGYKNNEGKYVVLGKKDAKRLFYPDGMVFAGKFQFDREGNPIQPNSFIEFSVKQSSMPEDEDKDDYIVDYDPSKKYIQKVFTPIITVYNQYSMEHGFISQNELLMCINEEQLESLQGVFFLKYQNKLYGQFRYEKNTKIIRADIGKECGVFDLSAPDCNICCIKIDQSEFYIGDNKNIPLKKIGLLDCMDDKQLGEWFKKQLSTCFKTEFLLTKKEIFQEFASSFNEGSNEIEKIRLERIKGKIDSLEFTLKEIKELINTKSVLLNKLNNTLKQMKDEFSAEWSKPFQKTKKEIEGEIKKLKEKAEKLSSDYLELDKKYKEKEHNLEQSTIEKENKYKIIKDNYDLIVESVKIQSTSRGVTSSNVIFPKPIIFNANGDNYSTLEDNEGYTVLNLLRENLKEIELPKIVKDQINENGIFLSSKACFIPSVSWAYIYAKALSNAKLYIIHVEHDWLHYSDFINNGLFEIFKMCDEERNINHILVFDSLNLTQPECGLKPLLDAISGYSIILPRYDKPLPDNLKIFATIVSFSGDNRIGLPLSMSSFRGWGQICSPDDKIVLPTDFFNNSNKGYIEPQDIHISINSDIKKENNGYFAE